MTQLLAENARMENIGPVIAPGLYLKEERRCAAAIMVPLCKSSLDLIRTYDAHLTRIGAALAAVKG